MDTNTIPTFGSLRVALITAVYPKHWQCFWFSNLTRGQFRRCILAFCIITNFTHRQSIEVGVWANQEHLFQSCIMNWLYGYWAGLWTLWLHSILILSSGWCLLYAPHCNQNFGSLGINVNSDSCPVVLNVFRYYFFLLVPIPFGEDLGNIYWIHFFYGFIGLP